MKNLKIRDKIKSQMRIRLSGEQGCYSILEFFNYLKIINVILFRNVIHNLTSITNVSNLEQLRGYPFSSEYRKNSKNGKMIVVYKWDFDGCGKEFLRTWNLLDHIRMHFGERPFSCQYCRKTFTQRGNLRKHLQQHFAPTLDQRKKYRCSHCPSSFTERYNFRVSLVNKCI